MITQRPSKIADDTLSQCASQLIMRLTNPDDQKAVQRASEVVSQALLDHPRAQSRRGGGAGAVDPHPGHGARLRAPGGRGGADINLVERFGQARSQALAETVVRGAAPPPPPTPTAGRQPRKEVKLL